MVVPAGRPEASPAHRVHAEAHGAGVRVRGDAVRRVRVPAVRARAGASQPLATRLQGAGGWT